ncbi:MAG: hypothetical protein MK085_10345 [Phycisphaerales bacterium]|nr:hypothetical protein [Phycisphaerales bacterium]
MTSPFTSTHICLSAKSRATEEEHREPGKSMLERMRTGGLRKSRNGQPRGSQPRTEEEILKEIARRRGVGSLHEDLGLA